LTTTTRWGETRDELRNKHLPDDFPLTHTHSARDIPPYRKNEVKVIYDQEFINLGAYNRHYHGFSFRSNHTVYDRAEEAVGYAADWR